MAGVAAARGGNGIGVTGAAPLAGIAAQRLLDGGTPIPRRHQPSTLLEDCFLIDTDDEANRNDEDSLVWTFTSCAYFGESRNGDWTVQLTNGSTNTNPTLFGTWENLQHTVGTGSLSIIPEPGVWTLLLLGVLLLIARRHMPNGGR